MTRWNLDQKPPHNNGDIAWGVMCVIALLTPVYMIGRWVVSYVWGF